MADLPAGADTPPVADEAMEAAFADWYQAHVQQTGCEYVTHAAWQAAWTAARAYDVRLAESVKAEIPCGPGPCRSPHHRRPFASLLRGEGGARMGLEGSRTAPEPISAPQAHLGMGGSAEGRTEP